MPSVPYMTHLAKILILILRRDHKKISYERCDYESVDEKNLSFFFFFLKEKHILGLQMWWPVRGWGTPPEREGKSPHHHPAPRKLGPNPQFFRYPASGPQPAGW